jgi:hypothetical protein
MADDLIPPPSPARVDRKGDPPKLLEPPVAPPAKDAEPAPPPGPSRYRSRFGVIAGVLVGILLVAGGITAALVVSQANEDRDAARWSPWRPKAEDGQSAARQIAEHVQRKYRLANGDQLALVASSPLEVSNIPLTVALRTAAVGGDIKMIEGDHAVMYTLNGLGPNGTISKGKPSAERMLLARREALELALYTFRYVDDVDVVVALLPPPRPPTKAEETTATEVSKPALFFRPGDLKRQLELPLDVTIPTRTPRPETIPSNEKARIQGLTGKNLFLASFRQAQDARAFLVLDRFPD